MLFTLLSLLPAVLLLAAFPFIALALHVANQRALITSRRSRRAGAGRSLLHAGVVSLSPASHSPRATNHAQSFARCGKFTACLHACGAWNVFEDDPLLSFIPIPETHPGPQGLSLARRVVAQSVALYQSLVLDPMLERYDVILVNSPPCIPVFAVVWFAARFVHSCPVVVDWHNFGYTIMQTTGKSRVVVAVARFVEWLFGRQMDGHFCVSQAMATFLAEEWAVDAHVLYDRPRDNFRRLESTEEQHNLFMSLHKCAGIPLLPDGGTIRTIRSGDGTVRARQNAPAVIVSSSSWTPDEDFTLLLESLVLLDAKLETRSFSPTCPFGGRLVCVLTGKGPLRAEFEEKCEAASLKFVEVIFAWLPRGDYPRLLGSSDLGISLHTSSSGLDLPMKVVDMLGCGLPVLSFNYKCVGELVRPGETGLLFGDSASLAELLEDLLFEHSAKVRRTRMVEFITNIFSNPKLRCHETWVRDALPVVTKVLEKHAGRRTAGGEGNSVSTGSPWAPER